MKIGQFSAQFSLSPETVRFYVNKGLLVPNARHGRYNFSAQDSEDMEFLLKLKGMRFSLADIHRILSLKRLSSFDSADELNDYLEILKGRKKHILHEKSELEDIIADIDYEIKNASGKHIGKTKHTGGVPIAFLPHLACPHCRSSLDINNCNIERGQIMSGAFVCKCGYTAQIQNGIIIGEPGHISIYDGPDLDRYCYRMMSSDLITLMKKNYQWILEHLDECNTQGKIILEDFVNDYCFCHANFESLDSGAYYVICDKFPEIVQLYKNLIDKMGLDHEVLYIAAASHLLPLKPGSVDIYIDTTANEYAMFDSGFSIDALAPYFHDESAALGNYWHFDLNSESIRELHRHYPDSFDKNFDRAYFARYLERYWHEVVTFEELGIVYDSGESYSFSYHKLGEPLYLNNYHVRRFRKESVGKVSA